jgi:hypothetical protein
MFRPSYVLGAMVSLAALSACNDTNGNFVHTNAIAVVRFVNASDTPISVLNNGVLDTLNTSLVFGGQSSCLLVDLSTTTTTPLTFTNGVTRIVIPGFSTPLFVGGSFTVVAFSDASGVVQLATLGNAFTPLVSEAGLRFFNAAVTSGTVFMASNGQPITTGVNFGGTSGFVNVPAATQDITFTNGTSTVLDAGGMTFIAGQNTTIIFGPPVSGTTTPFRFFTVAGC